MNKHGETNRKLNRVENLRLDIMNRMNRRVVLLLAAFIVSMVLPVKAEAGSVQGTQAIVEEKEDVVISSYDDGEFYVLDTDGNPIGGYAYELQVALNRYLNWNTSYQTGIWSDNLEAVKQGDSDIVFGVFKTAQREKDYVYNKTPIAMVSNYICGRLDEELLKGDYSKLEGKTFGLVEGTTSSNAVKEYLNEQDIEVNYIWGNSAKEMRTMLSNGEIDAYVTNANIDEENEKILQEFSTEPMYIMATKDKQNLMEEFDLAIEQMNVADPTLMKTLLSKVYNSKSACLSTTLNEEDWNFLSTAKLVRCGVISNSKPYFSVSKEGVQEGIIKEITDQISEGLGLKIILIPYNSVEEELQALEEGQIDMLGRMANDWHEAQEREVNLSISYLSTAVTIVKSKTLKPSESVLKKVAIEKDAIGHSKVLQLSLPTLEMVAYDSIQDCVDAVNRGEVGSAIVENFSSMVNQGAIGDVNKLYSYTATGIYFQHCFGISDRLDIHYVEILDKAISNLDTTDINMSAFNSLDSGYVDNVVELFLNRYKYQIIVWTVLFFVLLMLIYIFYSRYEKEKLRVGDERFRIATKLAQVTYWEYDCNKEELSLFNETLSKRHNVPLGKPMAINFDRNSFNFDLGSLQNIKEGLWRLGKGEESFETDLFAKGEDEENYYYKLKMIGIWNRRGQFIKAIGSVLDVTDRKRVLQLYEEESSRNKMLGKFIRASAMVNITKDQIDTHSDFLLAKRGELSGDLYTKAIDGLGELIQEPKQKQRFCKMFNRDNLLESYKNGHTDASITVQMPNNGKLLWEEINIHTMEDPVTGDIKAAIYARDAKERETLQSALDLAEHANNAKTNFLSSVSHEIRTPMNAIIGLTDMALEEVNGEGGTELFEHLYHIKVASRYLLAIINDILEMSRIESGKINLDESEINMKEFLKTVSTIVDAQAKEKGVELTVLESEKLDQFYIGDEIKLKKVLINILGNAVKFTGKGGKVNLTTHVESSDKNRSMIRFVVEDTGIGMEESYIKEIFKPFSREARQSSNFNGTGLGMSISKNFVELMDGNIIVESKEGVGTTMTITVALRNSKQDELTQEKSMTKEESKDIVEVNGIEEVNDRKLPEDVMQEKWRRTKLYRHEEFVDKTVLLVEDRPLNVLIASNFLSKIGFSVEVAEDGKKAVNLFENSQEDYYFAILMDIQMPIMNGIEATKVIRKLERKDAKNVPIIAMTANAFDIDRQKSLDAGMNEHITKPIDAKLVTQILMKFVKN